MWRDEERYAESARKVCDSAMLVGENPKSVWWNDKLKVAVMKKEAAWKEVLAASDEEVK